MSRKTSNIDGLLESLESGSSEMVYKSLVVLRTKFIKENQKDNVSKFREKGGLKILLPLIRKPNRKIADVALSILGNCCLEHESRLEVKKLDGVSAVVTVLQCIDSESIQNRVCRTIANLALNPAIATIIHEGEVIPLIVQFLQKTKHSTCQQSAVRALRILSNSVKHRDNVVRHDGVQAISTLLTSEDEVVLTVVVRCLARLTHQCTPECAQQVQAAEGFSALVTLASHDNETLRQGAILTLTNLVHQGAVRPSLGNAGAVTVFMKEIEKIAVTYPTSDDRNDHSLAVTALCLCCRESVNRVRIREGGGLKQLVSLLSPEMVAGCEDRRNLVISSLLNFLYDELSLDMLMELGVITALVEVLGTYVAGKCGIWEGNCDHEVEDPNVFQKKSMSDGSALCTLKTQSVEDPEKHEDDENEALKSCFRSVDDSVSKGGGTKRRLDYEDSNSTVIYSEAKVRQTYRINSPSYQQVQKEMMTMSTMLDSNLGSMLDDAGQWSPTNTVYSPGSPDFHPISRLGTSFNNNWASSSSSGGMSPDWVVSDDRSQLCGRRGSEDDRSMMYFPATSSQSPSPLTLSPVDSPVPQYACYSPICEEAEFSDQEEVVPEAVVQDNEKSMQEGVSVNEDRPPSSSRSACQEDGSDSVDVTEPIGEMLDEDQESSRRQVSGSFSEDNPLQTSSTFCMESVDFGPTYVNHLLMILSRFSQMDTPHAALLTANCVDALLALLTVGQKVVSRAARILCRLARNPLCFESLILMRFPRQVVLKLSTTIHSIKSCRTCGSLHNLAESLLMNLSMLAESPFGTGILTHILSVGSPTEKASSAFAVPYLIRCKSLRNRVFLGFKSLDLLFSILSSSTHEEFIPAVDCLVKICQQMESTFVSSNVGSNSIEDVSSFIHSTSNNDGPVCLYETDCNHQGTDVSFILDDGLIVNARRNILSRSSAVFEAMLEGTFTEAEREDINFGEAARLTLEFVVHYLYGCRRCPVLRQENVDLLLDVSALADRLLLNDLVAFLSREIVSEHLTINNLAPVYEFAQTHNCSWLAKEVLNAVLGSKFDRVGKVSFFNEVLRTELSDVVLERVKTAITEHLSLCPSNVQL